MNKEFVEVVNEIFALRSKIRSLEEKVKLYSSKFANKEDFEIFQNELLNSKDRINILIRKIERYIEILKGDSNE